MKTLSLIVVFLLPALLFGQQRPQAWKPAIPNLMTKNSNTSLLIYDSTYRSDSTGKPVPWKGISMNIYWYDSNNNMTSQTHYIIDSATITPQDSSSWKFDVLERPISSTRYQYEPKSSSYRNVDSGACEYDSLGHCIKLMAYEFNYITNKWRLTSLGFRAFTTFDNISITKYLDLLYNPNRQDTFKVLYYYSSQHRDTMYVDQSYDTISKSYKNRDRYRYTYDTTNGRLLFKTYETYNLGSWAWQSIEKYNYNPDGTFCSINQKSYNDTRYYFQDTFFYYPNGKLYKRIGIDSTWYFYNTKGLLSAEVDNFNENYTTGSWTGRITLAKYFYDSLNLLDTTINFGYPMATTVYHYTGKQPVVTSAGNIEPFHRWEVKAYPNPVSQVLHIGFSGTDVPATTDIEIYNSLGVLVYNEHQIPAGRGHVHDFDVSRFPKGLYLLKVQNKEGAEVKRFVKE